MVIFYGIIACISLVRTFIAIYKYLSKTSEEIKITTSFKPFPTALSLLEMNAKIKTSEEILVLDGDSTDREYHSLGTIEVSLSRTSKYGKSPTKKQAKDAIITKAAEIGADAILFVRYGPVLTDFDGEILNSEGLAIKFH